MLNLKFPDSVNKLESCFREAKVLYDAMYNYA